MASVDPTVSVTAVPTPLTVEGTPVTQTPPAVSSVASGVLSGAPQKEGASIVSPEGYSTDFAEKNWHRKALDYLDGIDAKIAEIPNNVLQDKIDGAVSAMKKQVRTTFKPLIDFRNWLDKREAKIWYDQLAEFLCKVPLSAALNVLEYLYNTIAGFLNGVVHPLQAMNDLAKFLVNMAHQFTQPETYIRMGAGIMGASLGTAVVGNPFSVIGFGIGLAMMLGGLTAGSIREMYNAKDRGQAKELLKAFLMKECAGIPEAVITGFVTGIMMGLLQRGIQSATAQPRVTDAQSAQVWADRFVSQEHLPKPDVVGYDYATREVVMQWKNSADIRIVQHAHPWWGSWVKDTGRDVFKYGFSPNTYVFNPIEDPSLTRSTLSTGGSVAASRT